MARLSIDRLSLELPDGYQHRAGAIVRDVADELSRKALPASAVHDRLQVPPLQIPPGLSNRQVANRIADSIHAQLMRAP